MVPVLVVHRQPVVRRGIRAMLEDAGRFAVVESSGSQEPVLLLCCQLQPKVVLLDASLDMVPILETVRTIRAKSPLTRVILVANGYVPWTSAELIQAGASGCVDVGDDYESQVVGSVELSLRNGFWFNGKTRAIERGASLEGSLTSRESQVLRLIAGGLSNSQIRERLCISGHTLRNHTASLYRKLGISNRAEAVVYGYRHGLVIAEDGPSSPE